LGSLSAAFAVQRVAFHAVFLVVGKPRFYPRRGARGGSELRKAIGELDQIEGHDLERPAHGALGTEPWVLQIVPDEIERTERHLLVVVKRLARHEFLRAEF